MTKNIEGKMIMNWERFEERNWATEWSSNVWHCKQGFQLKRGYRLEEYKFPMITEKVRKRMGWDRSRETEPPSNMKSAWEQHKSIWEKMHGKVKMRRGIQHSRLRIKGQPHRQRIPLTG